MLAQLTSRPKVDRRVRLRQVLALFLIILSVTLFTWEFETLLWLPRPLSRANQSQRGCVNPALGRFRNL